MVKTPKTLDPGVTTRKIDGITKKQRSVPKYRSRGPCFSMSDLVIVPGGIVLLRTCLCSRKEFSTTAQNLAYAGKFSDISKDALAVHLQRVKKIANSVSGMPPNDIWASRNPEIVLRILKQSVLIEHFLNKDGCYCFRKL